MVEAMDQELREKFARLEAQVEALQCIPLKLDSIIQLQVTMASVQESTRSHTEKMAALVAEVKAQSDQISIINARVSGIWHRMIGGSLVLTILVLPVAAYVMRSANEQLTSIDRRVTGLEFEVKRAKADR